MKTTLTARREKQLLACQNERLLLLAFTTHVHERSHGIMKAKHHHAAVTPAAQLLVNVLGYRRIQAVCVWLGGRGSRGAGLAPARHDPRPGDAAVACTQLAVASFLRKLLLLLRACCRHSHIATQAHAHCLVDEHSLGVIMDGVQTAPGAGRAGNRHGMGQRKAHLYARRGARVCQGHLQSARSFAPRCHLCSSWPRARALPLPVCSRCCRLAERPRVHYRA